MKKVFIIIAIILTVAGLAVFAGAFAASGFDFSKLDNSKYQTNTYGDLDASFTKIEIRTVEADVTLKPSEDGKCSVVCVEPEKNKHVVSVEKGTLKIERAAESNWFERVSLFSFKPQSITVFLPAERYEALTVAVTTGDIDVKGIEAGNITVTGTTGDVSLKDVNCAETISVEVSTGKTVMTDVKCKTFVSSGSTGDLKLTDTVASVSFNIERKTGDVRFDGCDAGEIKVSTSTGDVSGTLLSEKVFITKTSTGDVNVPGSASGGKCEITTSTGDIKIKIEGR